MAARGWEEGGQKRYIITAKIMFLFYKLSSFGHVPTFPRFKLKNIVIAECVIKKGAKRI
jgi:hypothetical protein